MIFMEKLDVGKRMRNSLRRTAVLVALSTLFLIGCTHSLHVTNLADFSPPPSTPLKEPIRLGVTSTSDMHPQNRRYVTAIVDALQKNSSVASVVYPYNHAAHRDSVDALVDITINSKYSGQGNNFWINFPGFLIFAPAIWGYGYNAEIETLVNVTQVKNGASQQISIPRKYEFRHAAMNRTWTEVGWLEVGIIPFIGGIVFTEYDPKATDEFITNVAPYYGPHVAIKIVSALTL